MKDKHLHFQVRLVDFHLKQSRIPRVRCKLCVSRHTDFLHPALQFHSISGDKTFVQRKVVTNCGHNFVCPGRDNFHGETNVLQRGKENSKMLVLFGLIKAFEMMKKTHGETEQWMGDISHRR